MDGFLDAVLDDGLVYKGKPSPSAAPLWRAEIGYPDRRLEKLLYGLSLRASLSILRGRWQIRNSPGYVMNQSPFQYQFRGEQPYGTFESSRHMAYVIAEPCIGTKDTACVDACPVDCIHPKKEDPRFPDVEMLYIDPVECIDCGACVPVCPVSAIFALDDLPEKWTEFTKKNADYFAR